MIASLWGQAAGPPYDGDSFVTIYDIMQVTPLWGQNCLAAANPPETPVGPGAK